MSTHSIPLSKKKITFNYSKPAAMRFFPKYSRTSSNSMVNELSVFGPQKIYCILLLLGQFSMSLGSICVHVHF